MEVQLGAATGRREGNWNGETRQRLFAEGQLRRNRYQNQRINADGGILEDRNTFYAFVESSLEVGGRRERDGVNSSNEQREEGKRRHRLRFS